MRLAPRLVVAAALCAVAAPGCGVGEGDPIGEADVTVTRDYGAEQLVSEEVELNESESVLKLLDGNADVETRYGGGFVQSIDGIEGGTSDGRQSDWFFYVNGIESEIGAAEFDAGDGDRIWWDYRDWSTAMRVPAVVGSWPEPFLHDYRDERWSVGIFCGGGRSVCSQVDEVLHQLGIDTSSKAAEAEGPDGEIRMLVGSWEEIAEDPVARLLAGGPDRSGVFANFAGVAPSVGLTLLDERGRVAETLGQEAGLVAALRPEDGPPTWVVTGTDSVGVAAAIDLLQVGGGEQLRNRYAVATVSNGPEYPSRSSEGDAVKSALAYRPGHSALHRASPGVAIAFLGSLALIAFVYLSPLVLAADGLAIAIVGVAAGARRAVAAALRLALPLLLLMTVVNALITHRGDTTLLRGWNLPVIGSTDITLEALAYGAAIGMRVVVAILAFAVYSACVDPDRVLRALRPLAGGSALTTALVMRMVPVVAADAARAREASDLRGPAAAQVGRPELLRRLVEGTLDRAVDVAATLELRGHGLGVRPVPRREPRSPGVTLRFILSAAAIAGLAVAGLLSGAGSFETYPSIELDLSAETLGLCAALPLLAVLPFLGGRR